MAPTWQGEIEWMESAAALDVVTSELVVATADTADVPAYERLRALLMRVRSAFGIEAAFVSEWTGGKPLRRIACSEARALHELYGTRLLDAPPPNGAKFRFETVPVVSNGVELGTLCSRRIASRDEDEYTAAGALSSVARLIAGWFEEAELAVATA
jgi:hypothetical protein